MLKRCGIKDLDADGAGEETPSKIAEKDIVLLGFFREASSLVHEFELKETGRGRHPLLDNLLIIDFNPEVYAELNRRGIACLYGDIANMETLRHAHIQHAELVICTIPDHILKGTTNSRMLKQARQICPSAEVIVTADRINQALELYDEGADFVFIPRLHSTADLAKVIESGLREGFKALKTQHISDLRRRDEVLE
jgi:voltage-gated potassium channel Kch